MCQDNSSTSRFIGSQIQNQSLIKCTALLCTRKANICQNTTFKWNLALPMWPQMKTSGPACDLYRCDHSCSCSYSASALGDSSAPPRICGKSTH